MPRRTLRRGRIGAGRIDRLLRWISRHSVSYAIGAISFEDFIRLMRDDPEQLMVWLRLLSSDELYEVALSLRQRFLSLVAYIESEDGGESEDGEDGNQVA